MLSDKQVEEFRELYKKRFGEEIDNEEARKLGTNLVTLLRLIYKPIPRPQENNLFTT
jgi:hypothetical protein